MSLNEQPCGASAVHSVCRCVSVTVKEVPLDRGVETSSLANAQAQNASRKSAKWRGLLKGHSGGSWRHRPAMSQPARCGCREDALVQEGESGA